MVPSNSADESLKAKYNESRTALIFISSLILISIGRTAMDQAMSDLAAPDLMSPSLSEGSTVLQSKHKPDQNSFGLRFGKTGRVHSCDASSPRL